MHESDTYLMIMDEGREAQSRKLILRLGEKKLGPCDEASRTTLQGITDIERLERIADRLYEASTWRDLVTTP